MQYFAAYPDSEIARDWYRTHPKNDAVKNYISAESDVDSSMHNNTGTDSLLLLRRPVDPNDNTGHVTDTDMCHITKSISTIVIQ